MASLGVQLVSFDTSKLEDDIKQNLKEVLIEDAASLNSELRKNTPVRTGNLARNTYARVGESENSSSLAVISATDYSDYVEYGTWRMDPREFIRTSIYNVFGVLIDDDRYSYASYEYEHLRFDDL